MKILFVDVALQGHHLPYLKSASIPENDNVYILPTKTQELDGKQYVLVFQYQKYDVVAYLKWLNKIKEIAKEEQIDVVHFLYADILLKYFGLGLRNFGQAKIILSFHRLDNEKLKNIARNLLTKKANAIISHIMDGGERLEKKLQKKHFFAAYPSAYDSINFTQVQAKKELGIDTSLPIISVIGKLSSYKNLDVMFAALSQVKMDYYLLIAGKPEYYSKEYILAEVEKLNIKSKVILGYISDADFVKCIAASDVVVATYDKSFQGTSGPMTEGIRLKKTIVGCDHSNIGKYIANYHIGYSADAKDIVAISDCFKNAIKFPICYGKEMEELIDMQTVEGFRCRLKYIYQACENRNNYYEPK